MTKRYNYLASIVEVALEYVRDQWKYHKEHPMPIYGADFSDRNTLDTLEANGEISYDAT